MVENVEKQVDIKDQIPSSYESEGLVILLLFVTYFILYCILY